MMHYNYRYKQKKSKGLMIKIVALLGIIAILFLFIWKMPAKRTTIIEDIQMPNSTTNLTSQPQ
ncbi:MAG: hypothetical protein LBU68_02605 [Rickettsiales bacterium]|nr:hypothetical protein [Rickettsiales bacterium]